MSQTQTRSNGRAAGHPIAALHEAAEAWRVVVLRAGERAALVEAASIRGGAADELDALLRRHHVSRLVRIAPLRGTVCRCVAVPLGPPADMVAALALLAEAQLPEGVPAHRRCGGVIPDAPRAGGATGLLTAWRDAAEPDEVSRVAEETWTTVPAAAAFLRAPAGVVCSADRASGAIAVLAGGPDRSVARTLVGESGSGWEEGVESAVRETAAAAGAAAPEWAARGPLMLDEASRRAVEQRAAGVTASPRWLGDYGLALGAALAAAGNGASSPLASLHATPPSGRRTAPEAVLAWVVAPRHAWAVIAVSVLLALGGPLAISRARLAALEADARDLPELETRAQDLMKSAALYEQLESLRWPMTKLVSDISRAAPVGVVTETLRLSPDQGLVFEGVAQDSGRLNALQENLNRTGLFRSVRLDRAESSTSGVRFTMTGEVGSPHTAAPKAEDFAAQTLAQRLYGEGASNTAWSPSSTERSPRERPSVRRDENGENGPAPARAPERPSGSSSLPTELPPELSPADIAAMDKLTATKAWITRRNYINTTPNLDAAAKVRLEEEIEKLKAHNPGAGGGGGGGS